MFISKRAFNEAINKAVDETERKLWKMHEDEIRRRCEYDREEKFEARLRKIEEACGLVEHTAKCPCGMVVQKTTII